MYTEEEISKIEQELLAGSDDYEAMSKLCNELEELKANQEQLYAQWEELMTELEE